MIPRLTREQAAIISAYTGYLAGDFSAMHEYAEKKLGRPIQTIEFAYGLFDELRKVCLDDFMAICEECTP